MDYQGARIEENTKEQIDMATPTQTAAGTERDLVVEKQI
jgi:hypothetical protein